MLSLCTIMVDDQQEIGTATGIAGSMRATISTIMATVYSVVLSNRLTSTISTQVPTALVKAGLPATSVADWLTALTAAAGFAGVEGATAAIDAAGVAAYENASADAFQTVFLTTLAFTGVGMVVSLSIPNVEDKMTEGVAATLHERKTEKTVGA